MLLDVASCGASSFRHQKSLAFLISSLLIPPVDSVLTQLQNLTNKQKTNPQVLLQLFSEEDPVTLKGKRVFLFTRNLPQEEQNNFSLVILHTFHQRNSHQDQVVMVAYCDNPLL